jgi:hypothetical protein
VLRVVRLHIETPEPLDQLVTDVEAALLVLGGPCYVLVDITGLYVSPRLRNYVIALMQVEEQWIQAIAAFTHRPNHLAALVLSTVADYIGIPFVLAADEAAARSVLARYRDRGSLPPAAQTPSNADV